MYKIGPTIKKGSERNEFSEQSKKLIYSGKKLYRLRIKKKIKGEQKEYVPRTVKQYPER